MTSNSPARQSTKNFMLADEKVMPSSNYFGGTFYSAKNSAADSGFPNSMMQTAVNEQKMRVIKSNKREDLGSIDRNVPK